MAGHWTWMSYFSFEVGTPRAISCSCKSPTQAPPLRTPIADPDRCPGGIDSNHIKSSVFSEIAIAECCTQNHPSRLKIVVIPKYMPLKSRKVLHMQYSTTTSGIGSSMTLLRTLELYHTNEASTFRLLNQLTLPEKIAVSFQNVQNVRL